MLAGRWVRIVDCSGEWHSTALLWDQVVWFLTEFNADSPLDSNYIQIKYHPNSKRSPRVLSPKEYKMLFSDNNEQVAPLDEFPWSPFHSKEDFELVELAHTAALNKKQTDALIKLIKRCERNPGLLTFEGVQDLECSWDDADKLRTPACTFICYLYLILMTPCVTSLIWLVYTSWSQGPIQRWVTHIWLMVVSLVGVDTRPPHWPRHHSAYWMGCSEGFKVHPERITKNVYWAVDQEPFSGYSGILVQTIFTVLIIHSHCCWRTQRWCVSSYMLIRLNFLCLELKGYPVELLTLSIGLEQAYRVGAGFGFLWLCSD